MLIFILPATTQIAIESYGSYGKLFIYDLLKKGYDIREVNIHEIADQVEEMRLLKTFLAIGGIVGATLLSEFGDIDRFGQESCLSAYCGVSPVIWQSGTGWIKWTSPGFMDIPKSLT